MNENDSVYATKFYALNKQIKQLQSEKQQVICFLENRKKEIENDALKSKYEGRMKIKFYKNAGIDIYQEILDFVNQVSGKDSEEEELLKIFKWLETNMNKSQTLYFKLLDETQIGAYFKNDNRHFANFYISQILKIIRNNKDE